MADLTIKTFHHWYIERFVRLFEAVLPCGMQRTLVPKWYARVWGMPDNAWKEGYTSGGKTVGYHVGHLVGVIIPLAGLTIAGAAVYL